MKRAQPKAEGNYKLVAMGATVYLPSRQEVIKAAAWLGPDVLCTVTDPKGRAVFTNAAAREITALGRPLGSVLRVKAQGKRNR
ncbi:MAG: hypothetical protein ACRETN_14010 [Nevskiales bacterium]